MPVRLSVVSVSVCLSVCLYTIRSSERRRVCVDHSSRRSDEIDTLLLLLTRLHKRSPIEQHTEIRTRKKLRDSATPPELARKQARDATTTPEQNNVVRKKNNKPQNLGNGGWSATNGFQILAPTVTFRVYSAPYIPGTNVGRLLLFFITAG
jgi:hypothetical protein